jgi:hypothetical protein
VKYRKSTATPRTFSPSIWDTDAERSVNAKVQTGNSTMTVSGTIRDDVGEIVESRELAALLRQLPLEPRCRVCRNDALRGKVNDLLAVGASYAMILRAVEDDNTKLDKRDRVTIDSIRNHTARHFPVQNVARATYRQILERRAEENGVDFVEGVATAITPMAFFETVMAKGYETLVDSGTKVDVNTGMVAAARLQELTGRHAGQLKMIDLRQQMDRIVVAAREFIPEEHHEAFLARVEGRPAPKDPLIQDTPSSPCSR